MIGIRRTTMGRPQQPDARPRAGMARSALCDLLLPLMLGALCAVSAAQAAPAAATQNGPLVKNPVLQARKARGLKALPSHPAGIAAPAAASSHGSVSPYARAAAQRADSGLPPPGHPQVLHRDPAPRASMPAQ